MSDLWEQSPALLVSWCVWVIGSICLHELGHGIAAIWQGDSTPRDMHRMTLNPLVHMGGASLFCFAIFGFAWGLMPVDRRNFRWGRWGDVLVSFAGPLVNILLAGLALLAAAIYVNRVDQWESAEKNIYTFLVMGGSLNLFLAMFNLLPIPPLDGSTVIGGLHPAVYRFYANDTVRTYGGLALLVVFAAGIGGQLFVWSSQAAEVVLEALDPLVSQ